MNETYRRTGPEFVGRWFSVLVPSSHVEGGGGRTDHHVNYVYASNAIDALTRVKRMRGWKRDIGSNSFPEISALTDDEIETLEQTIKDTPNVNLSQAKKFGFYGRREEK